LSKKMLEIARPEARRRAHSESRRFAWGIVDVILGVMMLPFGVWIWLIERMVGAVSALQRD
jgi:hypothetical protein